MISFESSTWVDPLSCGDPLGQHCGSTQSGMTPSPSVCEHQQIEGDAMSLPVSRCFGLTQTCPLAFPSSKSLCLRSLAYLQVQWPSLVRGRCQKSFLPCQTWSQLFSLQYVPRSPSVGVGVLPTPRQSSVLLPWGPRWGSPSLVLPGFSTYLSKQINKEINKQTGIQQIFGISQAQSPCQLSPAFPLTV